MDLAAGGLQRIAVWDSRRRRTGSSGGHDSPRRHRRPHVRHHRIRRGPTDVSRTCGRRNDRCGRPVFRRRIWVDYSSGVPSGEPTTGHRLSTSERPRVSGRETPPRLLCSQGASVDVPAPLTAGTQKAPPPCPLFSPNGGVNQPPTHSRSRGESATSLWKRYALGSPMGAYPGLSSPGDSGGSLLVSPSLNPFGDIGGFGFSDLARSDIDALCGRTVRITVECVTVSS
jgi:hypothetical protein